MPHRPSRRTFLKGVAGAAGAAVPLVSHRRTTAQTPATVKYLTWWWAEKGRNDAWRGIVKKFHDAQKDIRIQEVGFPYSEFFQRVTTQIAGGRLDADVLSFYDELGIRLIKTGVLAPVDDVVQKLGIPDKLDKTVHQFVTAGGKLHGLLAVNVPYALIYNRDLYQAAGVARRRRARRSTSRSPSGSRSAPTSSGTPLATRCRSRTAGGRTSRTGCWATADSG